VKIGEVMRALAAGEVLASRHPRSSAGERVTGTFGVQDFPEAFLRLFRGEKVGKLVLQTGPE
jgi:NADPH-dependent curcumin reductase CurA